MELIIFAISYILWLVLVGYLAKRNKRFVAGYLVTALFITPLLTLILLLVLGKRKTEIDYIMLESYRQSFIYWYVKHEEKAHKITFLRRIWFYIAEKKEVKLDELKAAVELLERMK